MATKSAKSEQEAYRKARDAAAAANKVMRKAIDDLFAGLARVGMSYDDARTLFDRLVDDPPRGILLPTPARVMLMTYKTGGQGRLAPDVVYLSLVNGFDTMMEDYGITDGWNKYAKVAEQTAQAFDSMIEELKNVEGRSDEDEYTNAPLGKYAWPDDRIGMPLEKNTELEDRLFNAIVNHFDSNIPITEDDAKELQALLKMGLYKDVLKQPNVEFVYRGVKLKSDDVTKLTGQSEKELVKRLDDSGALFVVLPPVQKSPWRSRKGASVSWTTSSAKAKEFTGGLYTATGSWGVVAVAKVADNPDTFLAGVDGLYKLRTIGSIYEPEREALAIAPVKIHALRVYRPSTRVSSMLSNSNVKKANANATKKEGIVKNVDRLMSAINEVVLKTNTYVLNSRDARLICKGEGSSMRVVHDGDTVHDLGESMKNVDGVHVRKVRLDEGFVGWVEWNAFEPTDKTTISENQAPWTVRKGETVFVRQSDGKRDSWKPHVLKKVTYFTDDELVERPDNNWGNRRTWVFQRGNWKCAVREEQFFAKPE